MEAKLKSLRVADLREILQKASVAIPAKSNKSDLIAKILASPSAVEAFSNPGTSTAPAVPAGKPKAPESSHGGQEDDLLAPPEEFDWGSASNGGHAPSAPTMEGLTTAPPKTATTKPLPTTVSSTVTQESSGTKGVPLSKDTTGTQDDEVERRKKRAARFGIPLVESKPKAALAKDGAKVSSTTAKSHNPSAEELAKVEARAARFGVPKTSATTTPPTGQKRAREPAPVDNEEMERRKKRAERFSTGGDAKAQG